MVKPIQTIIQSTLLISSICAVLTAYAGYVSQCQLTNAEVSSINQLIACKRNQLNTYSACQKIYNRGGKYFTHGVTVQQDQNNRKLCDIRLKTCGTNNPEAVKALRKRNRCYKHPSFTPAKTHYFSSVK